MCKEQIVYIVWVKRWVGGVAMYYCVGNTGTFRSFPFLLFPVLGRTHFLSFQLEEILSFRPLHSKFSQNRKLGGLVEKSSTESSSNQPVQWDGIDFWRIRPWEAAKVKAFWHHLPSITSRCGYSWDTKNLGGTWGTQPFCSQQIVNRFLVISIFIRQRGSNRNHIYVVNKGDLSFPHKNDANSKFQNSGHISGLRTSKSQGLFRSTQKDGDGKKHIICLKETTEVGKAWIFHYISSLWC